MPSYIQDYGCRGNLQWNGWDFGAHVSYYRIQPQNPMALGHFSDAGNRGDEPVQNAVETILSAQYSRLIGYWLEMKAVAGVHWYLSPEGRSYFGITPKAALSANLMEGGTLELRYGIRRQNQFQLGFTNVGLPCEFWLAAGKFQAPQWSHIFTLSYNVSLPGDAFSVSTELYYRQLHIQLEYVGSILDIYTGHYSLESSIARGKGRAFGANFMFQKHNSARLPAYSRLDISANWYIKKGPRGKMGLNFSMYNVLGKKNELGYGMHINPDFTAYSFQNSGIQLRFLPALAFFMTF